MSVFTSKTIGLRDGAEVLLRSPEESEAQRLLEYLDAVRCETDGIMFSPEDELPSLEEERQWILGSIESDGCVHVAAEVDGQIVGLAGIDRGKWARQHHIGGVGISIREGWCGRGLGTVMMRVLVDWACGCPGMDMLTLCVNTDNPRAIAVYHKVGFCEDGRLPKRIKRGGKYVGLVEMSLWLAEAEAPA